MVIAENSGQVRAWATNPGDWLGSTAWQMPSVIILQVWLTAGYNMVIFLVGTYNQLFSDEPYEQLLYSFVSVISHFVRDFAVGVVDLRYVALYALGTAIALGMTVWTFEARKWR